MMTHRERILAALRHERPDRWPTDMWATGEVFDKLQAHFGVRTNLAVYDALHIDGIMEVSPPYIGPELKHTAEYRVDFWGLGYRTQAVEGATYEELVFNPLAEAETIADLEAYAWPSPDWFDYAKLPELAEQFPGRAIGCGYTAVFFLHNLLRGLATSLMDPLLKPEFTLYFEQRLSDFFTEYHRRCYEALRGRMDTTQVTDDLGMQTGLLISPAVFERFYRPFMQRAIDLAHSYGLTVFHHDDGDLRGLLPQLTQMGIDVLNPIQWRCGDWDLAALKAQYGGQVCFHGGVDNQHTLPFGTPDEVRAEVRRLKATLGADGTGYIIAPCHNLQGITPVENILALYETAHEG
ncbi:MAG: hypothetical protein IT317_06390 [Anaerolineales bacterium]|nr:hypothetical protein [Anaerolineales bacterium]